MSYEFLLALEIWDYCESKKTPPWSRLHNNWKQNTGGYIKHKLDLPILLVFSFMIYILFKCHVSQAGSALHQQIQAVVFPVLQHKCNSSMDLLDLRMML